MTPGQYFTASMVRRLKGAPLAIYILLRISRKPESAEYLEMYSGYSDKVVQKALYFLQEERYITRNGRYSWQLSTYASQLPLMAQTGLEPPAGGDEACDPSPMTLTGKEPVAGDMDPERNASQDNEESENLRLGISDSSSSSRYLIKNSRNLKFDPLLASNPDPEILRLLLAVLDDWGIREPARSGIARMPGMTVKRIDYHCETCKNRGQAIYRIKNDWPIGETEFEYDDPIANQDKS